MKKVASDAWFDYRIRSNNYNCRMGQVLRHLEEQREQDKQHLKRLHQLERQVLEFQVRLDPPDAAGGRPVKR